LIPIPAVNEAISHEPAREPRANGNARRLPRDAESSPPASNGRGQTFIDDEVVSVIARIAAEHVDGVHKLGASNLRGMISRLGRSAGVEAEVGLQEAAVDIEIVVEYGYPIRDVADELREAIIDTVEATTGRSVIEVNVYVVDVHLPEMRHRGRRVV